MSLLLNGMPLGTRLGSKKSYSSKVAKILPSNLIGWWKMADTSGTICTDSSPLANNGTYTNITLGQPGFDGNTCALIDNSTDGISVVSTVAGDFNGAAGGFNLWLKPGSGVWDTSTNRRGVRFRVDASNQIYIAPFTDVGGNSFLDFTHIGGGTTKSVVYQLVPKPSDWFSIGMTWSTSEFKGYYYGVQVGTTQTGLGVFAGTLAFADIAAGAGTSWLGWVQHCQLYNVTLDDSQMLALGTQTPG